MVNQNMADEKGSLAILYNDPRLQMERFSDIKDLNVRFEELSNTAVENLMVAIILETTKGVRQT